MLLWIFHPNHGIFRLNPKLESGVEKLRFNKNKQAVIKINNQYKILDKTAARIERFWNDVILPPKIWHLSDISKAWFMKEVIRWDIFEERFLAFIVHKMDLEEKKIRKLSFFQLVKLIFHQLSTKQTEYAEHLWPWETIYHPVHIENHPKSYNGPVVLKEDWIKFVISGTFEKVLEQAAKTGIREEQKINENK